MSLTRQSFAVIALLAAAASTHAGPITSVGGLNGLGSFNGTFTYVPTDATKGTLNLTLNNTSPLANGGYLTAFVFNNPGQRITGASLWSSDVHFQLLGGPAFNNAVNGAPYGRFDLGASTGGSFEGGGNPSKGIAAGGSEDFVFHFTGSGMDSLTTQDFFSTFSVPPGSGEGVQAFAARFRGFECGGSDKVPGMEQPVLTPEPATLPISLAGLAVIVGLCRLRRVSA
ncbi:MAG: hypothetical protein U0791_16685 [Gemmataceae bacterium]